MVQAPLLTDSEPAGVGLPMSAHVQSAGQPGGGEGCTISVTDVLCVADVPVPVTVSVVVPVGVDGEVVIVIVELLPEVTEVGLKLAPAPVGKPLALMETDCDDPLVVAVLIDVEPLVPAATVTVLGLALMEKSFGGDVCTTSVTGVLCVADVPVPVTLTVEVPVGVDAMVVIVMVELPPEVTDGGLKLAPAPEGRPLALSTTFCDAPLVIAVLIVVVPLLPGATVTVLGLALMEKSFGGGEPQLPVPQATHALFDENGPMKPAVATTVSAPLLVGPALSLYVHDACPLLSV